MDFTINRCILCLLLAVSSFTAMAASPPAEVGQIISSSSPYRAVPGQVIDLNEAANGASSAFGIQVDEYGANSTVYYFTPVFPDNITTSSNDMPQITMSKDDAILIEVTTPDKKWLDTHSLFNITPYFYYYTKNGAQVPVYASENITIQFFDRFKKSQQIQKICMTSNKMLAKRYQAKGYMISAIPAEYLDATTLQILFRVGAIASTPQLPISTFVKVFFLQATGNESLDDSQYYNAADIIASFPTAKFPASSQANLNAYKKIVNYLNKQGYTTYQFVNYLSNIYGKKYAFDNFYKAITVDPAAQIQANNTGENYFDSIGFPDSSDGFIDLTATTAPYIYVLSANQNMMKASLTSNIQVYNKQDLELIPNGSIATAPDLPSFSDLNYPYVSEDKYPLFQINAYNISDLISSGITQIIIAERASYNPENFYASSYAYKGKAYYFFGNALTSEQQSYLSKTYGVQVTYTSN